MSRPDALVDVLRALGACPPGLSWVGARRTSPRSAWEACPNGAWLAWAALRVGLARPVVRAFARLWEETDAPSLPRLTEEDAAKASFARDVVGLAFAWGRGEMTDEILRQECITRMMLKYWDGKKYTLSENWVRTGTPVGSAWGTLILAHSTIFFGPASGFALSDAVALCARSTDERMRRLAAIVREEAPWPEVGELWRRTLEAEGIRGARGRDGR